MFSIKTVAWQKRVGFVKFISEKIMSIKKIEYSPSCSIRSRKSWGDLRFSHKSGIVVKEEILNKSFFVVCQPKLYIPSTLNTDYLQWHTQLILCALKWFKSWVIIFPFQVFWVKKHSKLT